MSKQKINLNDWEEVTGDIPDDYNILCITPQKIGKMQPDDLVYMSPPPDSNFVKDTKDAVWTDKAIISKVGTDVEYAERVDWWLNNARKDEEFSAFIRGTYGKNGFDVLSEWETMRVWLKGRNKAARKTHLKKFIIGWLNRNYAKHMSRKKYGG